MQINAKLKICDMEIDKGLKNDIESNQNRLKDAIRTHQELLGKLKKAPEDKEIQKTFSKAERDIIFIGIEQKNLIESLRRAFRQHQKNIKTNLTKNGIEERRSNLSNALNRARKQNVCSIIPRPPSFSDDSNGAPSPHISPEPIINYPISPHEFTQIEFLSYFSLATHETYKEMQNKRVERKRRSTANPHFLYGNKGFDFLSNKRKRNNYLQSTFSPPNTRQAVKRKIERVSPPNEPQSDSKSDRRKSSLAPIIPNLPNGLTIERVSPTLSEPKMCIACKESDGELLTCEMCASGFHINCHNRPLTQTPKRCPLCIGKENLVERLSVPTGMSISCVSDIEERVEEKIKLREENDFLTTELIKLQDQHADLEVSLNKQHLQQQELLLDQRSTQDKINSLLDFIKNINKASEGNSKEDGVEIEVSKRNGAPESEEIIIIPS